MACQEQLQGYAETKARAVIRTIPDGTYKFWDYMDDDFFSPVPVRLRVAMTIAGDSVHLDFTGTDPAVESAYNVPTMGLVHYWVTMRLTTFICTRDSSTPLNAGLYRPMSVTSPSGTILHAEFPDPVGIRSASARRLNDAVSGALSKAVPEIMAAPTCGASVSAVISEFDADSGRRKVVVIEPMRGGMGGAPGIDGVDARDVSVNNMNNHPHRIHRVGRRHHHPRLRRAHGFRRARPVAGRLRPDPHLRGFEGRRHRPRPGHGAAALPGLGRFRRQSGSSLARHQEPGPPGRAGDGQDRPAPDGERRYADPADARRPRLWRSLPAKPRTGARRRGVGVRVGESGPRGLRGRANRRRRRGPGGDANAAPGPGTREPGHRLRLRLRPGGLGSGFRRRHHAGAQPAPVRPPQVIAHRYPATGFSARRCPTCGTAPASP